jgi:hypothetical protein
MFNPILAELIEREQYKDRFREAEQHRLVKAGSARQSAHRFDLRTSLGNLTISVKHLFKAVAHAD